MAVSPTRSRGPLRDGRERAVWTGAAGPLRFASIDSLVEHHTVDRFHRVGDGGPASEGTVEAWAEDACEVVEGSSLLDQHVVIGAAFWRRARQLMGQQPT